MQWYTNYRIDYKDKSRESKLTFATNCFSNIWNKDFSDVNEFSVFIPIVEDKSEVIEEHSSARLTNIKEAKEQINILKKVGFPFKYTKDKIENYDAFRVYFKVNKYHYKQVLFYATYIRYIYELAMNANKEGLIEKINYYSIFNIFKNLLKASPNSNPSLLFHIAEQCMNQDKINNNHSGSPISIKVYNYKPVSIKDRLINLQDVQSSFTKNDKIDNFPKSELKELLEKENYLEIITRFGL